jgi:hypothetical protein
MLLQTQSRLRYPEKRKANLGLVKAMYISQDRSYRPYEAVYSAPCKTSPYLLKNVLSLSAMHKLTL